MITKHHFEYKGNKVDVYWYENRYRYCVHTDKGIEYRELEGEPSYNIFILQQKLIGDMYYNKYHAPQMSSKCIRCSKHEGAPRKNFNLAPICERCYKVMEETTDTNNTTGNTWYEINPDGSKGSVIKEIT